ncbi:ethanolamine-phosphate phospho-lyase [Lates japonicus]|uniref:Ethanolamine-phosphate phospho-lyase n=1 Tax=Lates japonicus TaxID=270547 RepID=A0AAD3RM44_LATJO|nr:ethanolamine-phosphate phospho-lyase [Lates japonicus]
MTWPSTGTAVAQRPQRYHHADNAHHGCRLIAIDISPYKFHQLPMLNRIHLSMAPRAQMCTEATQRDHPDPATAYADEVKDIIDKVHVSEERLLLIAESLQSCGGQVILQGYFQVAERSRQGHFHADEAQVGLGAAAPTLGLPASGRGLLPDIVTMGSLLATGHPMSCVVTTREVAEAFMSSVGMEALVTGRALLGWSSKDMVELTCYSRSLQEVIYQLKEDHILLSADGPHRNVLKFKPPMCFTTEDADLAVEKIDHILTELEDALGLKLPNRVTTENECSKRKLATDENGHQYHSGLVHSRESSQGVPQQTKRIKT